MTVLDHPTEMLHADGQVIALFEPTDTPAPEANQEYERLVGKFGFKRIAASLQTTQRIATCGFTAFTGYELGITTLFLPTVYTQQRWSNYQFDTIPLPVLKTLEAVQDSGVFHEYEIWTPEVTPVRRVDPILVGVISDSLQGGRHRWMTRNTQTWNWQQCYGRSSTTQFFPLARWGESLIPFAEMESQVLATHKRLRRTCPTCDVRMFRIDSGARMCLECGEARVTTSAW